MWIINEASCFLKGHVRNQKSQKGKQPQISDRVRLHTRDLENNSFTSHAPVWFCVCTFRASVEWAWRLGLGLGLGLSLGRDRVRGRVRVRNTTEQKSN